MFCSKKFWVLRSDLWTCGEMHVFCGERVHSFVLRWDLISWEEICCTAEGEMIDSHLFVSVKGVLPVEAINSETMI